MAVKKILLAYDTSDGSRKALNWTVEFARQNEVEVHVVTVIDSNGMITLEAGQQAVDIGLAREQYLHSLNEAVEPFCSGYACTVRKQVLEGNPTEEMLHYAEKENVDLVICGTQGMGTFSALLLGSVAHKLVTYAKCPVLVIK